MPPHDLTLDSTPRVPYPSDHAGHLTDPVQLLWDLLCLGPQANPEEVLYAIARLNAYVYLRSRGGTLIGNPLDPTDLSFLLKI